MCVVAPFLTMELFVQIKHLHVHLKGEKLPFSGKKDFPSESDWVRGSLLGRSGLVRVVRVSVKGTLQRRKRRRNRRRGRRGMESRRRMKRRMGHPPPKAKTD